LKHPILGKVNASSKSWSPDDLKPHSPYDTLPEIEPTETIFQAILEVSFKGEKVERRWIIESMYWPWVS
jgi:hypothetical protein